MCACFQSFMDAESSLLGKRAPACMHVCMRAALIKIDFLFALASEMARMHGSRCVAISLLGEKKFKAQPKQVVAQMLSEQERLFLLKRFFHIWEVGCYDWLHCPALLELQHPCLQHPCQLCQGTCDQMIAQPRMECEWVRGAAVTLVHPCLGLGLDVHGQGTSTPEPWPEYPCSPRQRTMTPEQLWPDTDDGF
jgi:hypothetical protein